MQFHLDVGLLVFLDLIYAGGALGRRAALWLPVVAVPQVVALGLAFNALFPLNG